MNTSQLATFLGQHLGPTFERLGLWPRTQLTYGGQCARASAGEFVSAVMADVLAAKYMDVIAYHGYDCQLAQRDNPLSGCSDATQRYDVIAKLGKAFPHKRLWMTEICYAYNFDDPNCKASSTLGRCVNYPRNHSLAPPLPRTDFADGVTWGHRIIRELQAGASGWIYWNLLLDTTGGPYSISPAHNDADLNFQHPVVIVDAKDGSFQLTGLAWFLAHFSRFVRPGAQRLGLEERSLPPGVSAVAFREPVPPTSRDDLGRGTTRFVLQMVNSGSAPAQVTVCSGDGRVAELLLPAVSITTARWATS